MNAGNELNGSSVPSPENPEEDDFFGDQFSSAADTDRQTREIEALRHRHMTAGIREGSGAAHDAHLQQGFDEGFAAGACASAEAGFLLGCSSMLEAFLARNTGNSRVSGRGKSIGDTEVPLQDVRDLKREASRLRTALLDLREGGYIDVESAKVACQKVAIFDIPKELTEASVIARKNSSSL